MQTNSMLVLYIILMIRLRFYGFFVFLTWNLLNSMYVQNSIYIYIYIYRRHMLGRKNMVIIGSVGEKFVLYTFLILTSTDFYTSCKRYPALFKNQNRAMTLRTSQTKYALVD